jgi:predicted phosphodiesterase
MDNTLNKEYNEIVFPKEKEDYITYRDRITNNKDNTEYNLTWHDIKDLVRCFYNEKLSDNWRKFYYYKKEKEKYDLENNVRILDISDLHIPFNLPIEVYKKYIDKVDILVINGDLIDCYAMSKFTKMFRQPLIDELIKAREFCIELVNLIKPKKVIVVSGNHEIRLGKQIADKIGTDLLDLLPTDAMAFLFDTGFNHHNHQTKVKTVYTPLDEVFAEIGIECIYEPIPKSKGANARYLYCFHKYPRPSAIIPKLINSNTQP